MYYIQISGLCMEANFRLLELTFKLIIPHYYILLHLITQLFLSQAVASEILASPPLVTPFSVASISLLMPIVSLPCVSPPIVREDTSFTTTAQESILTVVPIRLRATAASYDEKIIMEDDG